VKLYIAEKPSLGRAIADALPKPLSKQEGYIRAANGDCVSWCVGHLLEQAEPDAYDPAFKQWKLEHLPIVPGEWRLLPKSGTRKQLSVLKQLVKTAETLVHAGDPDREGQLLVDEVIDYLGLPAHKRANIQRLLINDLNTSAVSRALQQLRSNQEFAALSTSALARSRADWLYGINMTRAFTLQGRKVGYNGVLSVGRVQTPVLGLVVKRDKTIAEFISVPYYEVLAHVRTSEGLTFTAQWQPSDACAAFRDEEGRILNKALAENVVRRIHGQPALVEKLAKTPKKQAPPLPYNLSSLQIDAARRFGMSAQQVLDTCQQLYERHQLITYPRSDSRHLPAEHYGRRHAVLNAIAASDTTLKTACDGADPTLKSKAWDDSKVDAHHAIIPTERRPNLQALDNAERQVYTLIARQYVCQFYPAYAYLETHVELRIAGGLFTATARQTQDAGWKTLFSREAGTAKRSGEESGDNATKPQDDELAEIPPLNQGDTLLCERGEMLEKHTRPPPYFTDATLLAAMTGIARFVQDPAIRKILKDTDGLGTEATRAGIIELLFKRGFLRREGKTIRATPAGTGLIESLPESAVTPDMTAQWESALDAISQKQADYHGFMKPLESTLHALIEQSKQTVPTALRGVKASRPAFKRRGKSPATGANASAGASNAAPPARAR
jgi:DNA topoisomerase-3